MTLFVVAYAEGTAAAGAAPGGVLASLGLNLNLFIFQLINFGLVVLVIWFLILKPLTRKLAERQKLIEEGLENARQSETKIQSAETQKKEILNRAQAEAEIILKKTETVAEMLKNDLTKKAEVEAGAIIKEAKKQIQEEKNRLLQEIKEKTAELAVLAAEKILAEKITPSKDERLIQEELENLKL